MSKKRYVTQKVWVVVTISSDSSGEGAFFGDVVLLTPNKKKAERCVEVLNGDMIVPGLNLEAPGKNALIAKNLKAIKGTVSYESLIPYDNAACFQRTIKE